jgi:SAM-dependent methyltransferase
VGESMVPDELMRSLRAFQASRVLLTALELDAFTAVGAGQTTAAVAACCRTDPRATERLLNALVALGLMSKREGVFTNAPLALRFLVAGAPEDARDALRHHASLWQSWSTLTDAVRQGHALHNEDMSQRDDDQWTVPFIAAMHRGALERAPQVIAAMDLRGVQRLIDIGGGSGAYSIAAAQQAPQLRCEVLDLATVVPITERHIAAARLGARVTTRVGDLRRDELGSGYDLALLSSICHMLSPDENCDLLRRVRRALAPAGRVVISDFILEPDGTGPTHAVFFALNMLVGTEGGGAYTEGEYANWLAAAGFADARRVRLAGPADLMIGRKPSSA